MAVAVHEHVIEFKIDDKTVFEHVVELPGDPGAVVLAFVRCDRPGYGCASGPSGIHANTASATALHHRW